MQRGGINGVTVTIALVGSVMLYSGLKGKSISSTTRDLLSGKNPADTPTDTSSTSGPGTNHGPVPDPGTSTNQDPSMAQPDANRSTGRLLAASHGWVGEQWTALDQLWTRESQWENTAQNPSSGAYGIAQALPPSKYPRAGRPPSLGGFADPGTQIRWGLNYIAGRYGTPVKAWQHELAYGWY